MSARIHAVMPSVMPSVMSTVMSTTWSETWSATWSKDLDCDLPCTYSEMRHPAAAGCPARFGQLGLIFKTACTHAFGLVAAIEHFDPATWLYWQTILRRHRSFRFHPPELPDTDPVNGLNIHRDRQRLTADRRYTTRNLVRVFCLPCFRSIFCSEITGGAFDFFRLETFFPISSSQRTIAWYPLQKSWTFRKPAQLMCCLAWAWAYFHCLWSYFHRSVSMYRKHPNCPGSNLFHCSIRCKGFSKSLCAHLSLFEWKYRRTPTLLCQCGLI